MTHYETTNVPGDGLQAPCQHFSLHLLAALDASVHKRLHFFVQETPHLISSWPPIFRLIADRKYTLNPFTPLAVPGRFPLSLFLSFLCQFWSTSCLAYSLSMRSTFQMKHILLPLSAICLLFLIPTTYATCYFPNGKTNSGYRQCPNSLSCCAEGEACLSNGYCFTANFGILYRGLCADKTWPISDCPRACYEGNN